MRPRACVSEGIGFSLANNSVSPSLGQGNTKCRLVVLPHWNVRINAGLDLLNVGIVQLADHVLNVALVWNRESKKSDIIPGCSSTHTELLAEIRPLVVPG